MAQWKTMAKRKINLDFVTTNAIMMVVVIFVATVFVTACAIVVTMTFISFISHQLKHLFMRFRYLTAVIIIYTIGL
jgi:hypothetical protein